MVKTHILHQRAEELLELCRAHGLRIATAESCTAGRIIATLCDIAGASDVVDRGFITYSNAAKQAMLGVDPALIERVGAVSAEVSCAMAEGAIRQSHCALALAVTGIAGPGGGSAEKPVGLVHMAVAYNGKEAGEKSGAEAAPMHIMHRQCRFFGDRDAIRTQTVAESLALALTLALTLALALPPAYAE